MIESAVVILAACFIFFLVFQLAQIAAAKTVLTHAAARGARARSVGFNAWQVRKVIEVAAIPVAGRRVTPAPMGGDATLAALLSRNRPGDVWDAALRAVPSSTAAMLERSLIPMYLDSINNQRTYHILNYENWQWLNHNFASSSDSELMPIELELTMGVPIWLTDEELEAGEFLRPADAERHIKRVRATATIEPHAALYLDQNNW